MVVLLSHMVWHTVTAKSVISPITTLIPPPPSLPMSMHTHILSHGFTYL